MCLTRLWLAELWIVTGVSDRTGIEAQGIALFHYRCAFITERNTIEITLKKNESAFQTSKEISVSTTSCFQFKCVWLIQNNISLILLEAR